MPQRKALLIGINYFGTTSELKGCINDVQNVRDYLIRDRGFPYDPSSMVILTDDQQNPNYHPTHRNMMAAFGWLISNNHPGDSLFLHYSGHGGLVKDPDGDRASGYDDTICPVDYEVAGQISSDTLHRALVSSLAHGVRLTVIMDCCHSGTGLELPYTYRSDENGKVNLIDNVKEAVNLAKAARDLLHGGFSMQKINDAKHLVTGAKSVIGGFTSRRQEPGLGKEHFVEGWEESKDVWSFAGCRDDQTSADATIGGVSAGAMSWAFITTMRANPTQSYVQVLQSTRTLLQKQYTQIPQLSVGDKYDLDQVVAF